MKRLLSIIAVIITAITGSFAQGTEVLDASAMAVDHTFFANTEWGAETSSTATFDAGVLTVNVAVAKAAQWQCQVFLKHNVTFDPAKQYDVSFKITASKAVNGITYKMDENNGIFFENQSINVAAGETVTYSRKNITGAPGNKIMVFDFGYAAEDTQITVSEFSIQEHEPVIVDIDPTKPFDASSGNPELGADDNTGTRWESTQNDNQWWSVNYGTPKDFNTIQILWEGAYGKSFKLLGSNDGSTWADLKEITDQVIPGPFPYSQTIDLGTTVSYQYVKFVGISRGTPYGYSFWEFKTFVKDSQVLTTLTLTPASNLAKVGTTVALAVKTLDQYGTDMAADVSYSVTPADAGTVDGGVLTVTKPGAISITATSGSLTTTAQVFSYAGDNMALSTDIMSDNKIIAQSDFLPGGTDAYHAVDADGGSIYQGSSTNGTTDAEADRTYDSWFVIDLGKTVDIEAVSIRFEGACSQEYHLDFASTYNGDATAWTTGFNYVGTAGINGRTDLIYAGGDNDLANAQGVRYVRFFSTKAATQYGMKIFDMKVFATAVDDGSVDISVSPEVMYATMYYDRELTTSDDVKIYTGKISGDKLVLTELADKTVPANTAVIVSASAHFTATSTGAVFSGDNDLRGVNAETAVADIDASGILVIDNIDGVTGFYNFTATALPAHKAYIPKSAGVPAKGITIVFDDPVSDGIDTVESVAADSTVYTLNGIRVNGAAAKKGIYIRNGKKHVVK